MEFRGYAYAGFAVMAVVLLLGFLAAANLIAPSGHLLLGLLPKTVFVAFLAGRWLARKQYR